MSARRSALLAAVLGAAGLLLWNFVGARPSADALRPAAPAPNTADAEGQADPMPVSSRSEVPPGPSIKPIPIDWRRDAMTVLLCTEPLASGKPAAAFLADCR